MAEKNNGVQSGTVLIFILLNALGIFMFFIPITLNGAQTIPIDHIVTWMRSWPFFGTVYAIVMVCLGAALPFYNKTWRKDTVTLVFTVLKIIGIPLVFVAAFKLGPESIHTPDMMPFVFLKVVIPVSILVPIGAVFLAFIMNYGLMEFVGVFMRPIMRPVWRTPGRSAIDAVASFVGSYSVGLLITNKVYKEGYYSNKEASIIATGFSTVSATFMIIVAKTLGLMDRWNVYFWGTLVITFLVTAITTRLFPLRSMSDLTYGDVPVKPEPEAPKGKLAATAVTEGLHACKNAPDIVGGIVKNFKDGLRLSLSIAPTLLSVGFLGLVLAKFTPVFDVLGYIFLPLTKLLGFGPDAMVMAKGLALTLPDMFLPAGIIGETAFKTQAVMAIVCVSEVLFFSGAIPCILGTEIKISLKQIVIVWFERIVLSLLLATPFVYFFFR